MIILDSFLFVIVQCFRYLRLPIIKKEQGYCGNSEIAVLRGAVGQYNVNIHTYTHVILRVSATDV